MPPLTPAGAAARPAARTRASASSKPAPRKKPGPAKPKPHTHSAHYKPALRKPAAPRRKTASLKAAPLPIKQPPPPRATDPLAKKTGRRRTYYTPEFLAEAKRRIENTLQSTTSIALDLGTHQNNLWRLVRREGWVRPEGSLRLRGLSPAMRLAMQADALVGRAVPPPERGRPVREANRVGVMETEATPTPTLPLAGGGSPAEPAAPASLDNNAAIERLEAAVLKELATVETMRANLGNEPLRPTDAERTARTLSVLTETLSKLRRQRLAAQPQPDNADDDMPADIDEFRNELARRIDALVAGQPDEGGTDEDRTAVVETPQP